MLQQFQLSQLGSDWFAICFASEGSLASGKVWLARLYCQIVKSLQNNLLIKNSSGIWWDKSINIASVPTKSGQLAIMQLLNYY